MERKDVCPLKKCKVQRLVVTKENNGINLRIFVPKSMKLKFIEIKFSNEMNLNQINMLCVWLLNTFNYLFTSF